MKILITGGSGMVGQALVTHKHAQDYEILKPSRKELDLLDFSKTLQWVCTHKPDMIAHCAGQVGGIQANIKDPIGFFVNNLDMGRNIVMAAQGAGVPRLLNLGSSCMYPKNAENPLREEQVLTGTLEPTNEGYALAKIAVSRLCQYISSQSEKYQYKTLIPCNLYGPYDKFEPNVSHLVPAIIQKIHDAKHYDMDTVEIWGKGTVRREFMYSEDAADAIWHMVKHFEHVPNMINIGLGYDYSINEYYQAVAEVIGWSGRFIHDTKKPEGMAQKLLSVDRQSKLGWSPKISLADGIAKTYALYLEQHPEP